MKTIWRGIHKKKKLLKKKKNNKKQTTNNYCTQPQIPRSMNGGITGICVCRSIRKCIETQ